MTVTVASFLADYPVFNNASFSQTQIQRYLTIAGNTLDCRRWGDYLDLGTELFVAHNLSMDAMAQNGASGSGVPGQISGPATTKTVDKVSVGYDVSLAKLDDAGAYNLTSYGVRYWQLVQMVGMGGMQL